MIGLRADVKKAFFDAQKVLTEVDKKTLSVLNRFGASVRITAQRSMRTKKGSSPAGTPPYSHGQKKLRKNIFYAYDSKNKSVVVGPVKFERTSNLHVPSVLEAGGTITVQTRKGTVTRVYPDRPYMNPAFQTYQGRVASWYAEAK